MSAAHHEDELAAEQTAGFKVGEKKTIDEYQNLGKHTFAEFHIVSICSSIKGDISPIHSL